MRHQGSVPTREEGVKTLFSAAGAAYTCDVPAYSAGRQRDARGPNMADLFVVVTVLAFFGLCVGLVWGCDKIIGPDEPGELEDAGLESVDLPVEGAAR
jgi:hypothetical protein